MLNLNLSNLFFIHVIDIFKHNIKLERYHFSNSKSKTPTVVKFNLNLFNLDGNNCIISRSLG